MSREVEKDYEKLFQTKVLQLLRKLLLKYRKVTRLEGFRYLEVETVGHVALNLCLYTLYTFLFRALAPPEFGKEGRKRNRQSSTISTFRFENLITALLLILVCSS